MRKEDCKVDMKVVPFQKTVGDFSFDQFKERCSDLFLTVKKIMNTGCIELSGGWQFHPTDLNPYIEPASTEDEIKKLKAELAERDERIKALEETNAKIEKRFNDVAEDNTKNYTLCVSLKNQLRLSKQENEQRQSRIDALESTITILLERLCKD